MSRLDSNPVSCRQWGRSWRKLWGTLSAKLLVLLGLSMALVFGLLGYLNIQLHRRHLERAAEAGAARMSSVIRRNTSYYMLRNQRDGLYHIITDLANEPGVLRIRIINEQGRISFSSDTNEMGRLVDDSLRHANMESEVSGARRQVIRIFLQSDGQRALAVLNPIENSLSCSSAECHAHPTEIKTLGYLDMHVSLATT